MGSREVVDCCKPGVSPHRYDILCLEGLVRALRVFMGKIPEYPRFIAKPAAQPQQIIVEKEIQAIRPFVVGAVLRNVTFDDARYKSFIDLQGNSVHQTSPP
jgi:phenylalanyl-tRNA synthetase beta chain